MSGTQVVTNVGEDYFLDCGFNRITPVPYLYIGLCCHDGSSGRTADAAPSDTLALNLNEITAVAGTTGNGYARVQISNNNVQFVRSRSGNTSIITGPSVTFTVPSGATAGYTATHYFICTSADGSGILLMEAPLNGSLPVNAGPGATITVSPGIQCKQGT